MFSFMTKRTSSVVHNVLLQIVRYKRVNLRKPRPPHFQAKKVDKALSISIPRPYDTKFPEFLKCRKPLSHVRAIKEENPYEKILANELISLFENSKMILFFHRNPLSGEDFYSSVKSFKKANMELIRRSKTTVKMAVENTKYFPIMKIFHSHTLILCCTSFDLNSVFKILKKMPQYILLGGIVENHFLHRNKLEEYGQLSSLDIARGQFIHMLGSIEGQLNYIIMYQSDCLISSLYEYKRLHRG